MSSFLHLHFNKAFFQYRNYPRYHIVFSLYFSPNISILWVTIPLHLFQMILRGLRILFRYYSKFTLIENPLMLFLVIRLSYGYLSERSLKYDFSLMLHLCVTTMINQCWQFSLCGWFLVVNFLYCIVSITSMDFHYVFFWGKFISRSYTQKRYIQLIHQKVRRYM